MWRLIASVVFEIQIQASQERIASPARFSSRAQTNIKAKQWANQSGSSALKFQGASAAKIELSGQGQGQVQ